MGCGVTVSAAGIKELDPPFLATEKQQELADAWNDRGCRAVLIGGAIRTGKTQGAGRLLVETALETPSTFLVARLTYRELEDSTKRALLDGDGSLPPLIPPETIADYRKTDNLVELVNGARILFRSLDEPAKLLNLTLGGILIDQIEELDPGDEGERIFDTLLGRLSDPRGPRKLIAVANPASTVHWVYRRFVDEKTRDNDARYVHVTMRDNAANLPADYVESMEGTRKTRPYWYRSYVLGEWGSFEGAAFTEFDEAVHVVEPFKIPDAWERFESMDHGANNPTAWHAWATDHDGNLVVFDEYYSPGLISKHAPEILRRRREAGPGLNAWEAGGLSNYCHGDPSIGANHGLTNKWGQPASVLTEYQEKGLYLLSANNDRVAGYMRLLELLHIEEGRIPPTWAHVPADVAGSPRLFVFSSCRRLIEQLKGAPVAAAGPDAAEAVDAKWSSAHGHAVDSCRYGAMSRPAPSPQQLEEEQLDYRDWVARESERHAYDPDEMHNDGRRDLVAL